MTTPFSKSECSGDISETSPESIFNSVTLIAGTTVGAGVLALPAVTWPVGIIPSTVLMLAAWLYMVVSGLLIAEATLQTMQQTDRVDLGLLATIRHNLGLGGAIAAGIIYVFIHYALLIAYVARGGDILAAAIEAIIKYSEYQLNLPGTVPLWWGHIVFVVLFANILFWNRYQQIAQLNSILVAVVIITFCSLFALTVSQADVARLQIQHWENIGAVVPVMFVAFVYQNVVPVITKKLKGNRKKIRQSIWWGSCIPLVMFALWNTVILASIPLSYQQTGSVDPLEWMRTGATYPELKIAVSVFSELAIATSFIGFVFGLLDVFEDIFSPTLIKQNRKLFFYLLTFVPPLLLSLINPNVFYEAIDFAGAFGISILFGIIPALMVWRLRGENTPSVPLLVGGRPLLMGMIAIAIGVMLQKIASFGN